MCCLLKFPSLVNQLYICEWRKKILFPITLPTGNKEKYGWPVTLDVTLYEYHTLYYQHSEVHTSSILTGLHLLTNS